MSDTCPRCGGRGFVPEHDRLYLPLDVEPYEGKDGLRWRIIAPENGRIMADSGEAYRHVKDRDHAIDRIRHAPIRLLDRDPLDTAGTEPRGEATEAVYEPSDPVSADPEEESE